MGHLPIFLEVSGRRCVVVGGGEVAERKVAGLLEAGADVTVISPDLTAGLTAHARAGKIHHYPRAYRPGDIDGAMLVYAATDDAGLHQRLHDEARARGILINVADVPALCTFIAPAVMSRGELKIAVSTGGASPAMAARIVRKLEETFGSEYGLTLAVLRAARRHLRETESDMKERGRKLTALAASRIPEYLRKGDIERVDAILRRHLGAGTDALGLRERLGPANPDVVQPAR
jgi:precorrin-2 dehydrogenase/sirohydrochlorin ferrochelatase